MVFVQLLVTGATVISGLTAVVQLALAHETTVRQRTKDRVVIVKVFKPDSSQATRKCCCRRQAD